MTFLKTVADGYNMGLFYRRAKAFVFVMGDTSHHYEKVAMELVL